MSSAGPKLIDPTQITKTWSDKYEIAPGILVYKNVLVNELNLINRLEKSISDTANPHKWREATVGYGFKKPDYRDCVDFKFRKSDLHRTDESTLELKQIWQDCYDRMSEAVKDYCFTNNLSELEYWEVMNFVKYNKGQHFQEHTDHGYSYNATVSLVGYLNDDYEGGELFFSRQQVTVDPDAGDLVIFPSNFMYPHRAMPVENGTKYSLVTMLDYTTRGHSIGNTFAEEK
jgi:hypothetical protein